VLTPSLLCEEGVRDVDVAAVWVQHNAKVRVPQGRPDVRALPSTGPKRALNRKNRRYK
jgi:hypothetical protein